MAAVPSRLTTSRHGGCGRPAPGRRPDSRIAAPGTDPAGDARRQRRTTADRLADPGHHRDAVRDRRRPTGWSGSATTTAIRPRSNDSPRVGGLLDPNVERILSFKPDLVVVYETQVELKAQLERAGIPMFRYVHRGLPDIPRNHARARRSRRTPGRGRTRPRVSSKQQLAARRAARRRTAAAANAPGLRPRAGLAPPRHRQRRLRVSARSAGGSPAAPTCSPIRSVSRSSSAPR